MGREEIRSGNVLLTEKDKPQWFNERVALNWKSSGFYTKRWVFILVNIKQEWQHGTFIKEKIHTGCTKAKVKRWISI